MSNKVHLFIGLCCWGLATTFPIYWFSQLRLVAGVSLLNQFTYGAEAYVLFCTVM